MKFLSKMEKKYGRYAIRNLSLYMIMSYAIGYVIYMINPSLLSYLTLEPAFILRGQVWRIISWILIPPSTGNILITLIMLYFYYSVGNTLERTWGAFRYNVYILSGILIMVIGAFFIYFIVGGGVYFSTMFSTYYMNMTILLAFATTYPDVQILLYFLVPIKMKWLGIAYGAMLLIEFFEYPISYKIVMLLSMLNFIIYFAVVMINKKGLIRRKQQWTYNYTKTTTTNNRMNTADTSRSKNNVITRHKCAICGRTELDDDMLEFRFCSRCDGNYEYCQDHIFTHEHVKR